VVASRWLNKAGAMKIEVVHAMPGRLRLRCDQWKHEAMSNALERSFRQHPLVKAVSASPITGSLLLEFKTQHITQEQLDSIMKQATQAAGIAYEDMDSKLTTGMRGIVRRVDRTMRLKTKGAVDSGSLLTLFLLGKGFSGFRSNPGFSTALLLWAYGYLTKKGGNDD
jgi:hypothetical protein